MKKAAELLAEKQDIVAYGGGEDVGFTPGLLIGSDPMLLPLSRLSL